MVNATPHLFWITSRAAGIVALVLASLAVSLGLVMSLKFMRRRGPDLLATHEILSLSALVAIAVHGLSLLGDQFLHPSVADIAIPFVSGYRTFWTSLGIIAGWGLAALGLSYYLRRHIGSQRWRKLHRFTALLWIFGLAHSLGEGTDAGQVWFLAMIGIVAVPALALIATRYLTDDTPNARRVGPSPTPGPAGRPPASRPPGHAAAAHAVSRTRPGSARPQPTSATSP
jgi:methionine sulfoxide reductase heme-binding subunit